MARLAQVVVVVALCAAAATADVCIQFNDLLDVGQGCGSGPVGCRGMAYCGTDGVCAPRIADGEACVKDTGDAEPCLASSLCQGALGSQTCVPRVGAGVACNVASNYTLTTPFCRAGLNCMNVMTDAYCMNAQVGDSCQVIESTVSPCIGGMNCTNNVCVGAAQDEPCNSAQSCRPGMFCSIITGLCTPQTAAGGPCNTTITSGAYGMCADGGVCIRDSATATDSHCVARISVAAGGFCDQYGEVCSDTLRCGPDGNCASKRIGACSGGCSADETCRCGGNSLRAGVGYCKNNQECRQLYEARADCMLANCNTLSLINVDGTCATLNCKDQVDAYFTKCGSAGRVAAGALFALVAAFVARFVSSA